MALVPYLDVEDLPEPHRSAARAFREAHGRLPWLRLMAGRFPPLLDAIDAIYPRFMVEGRLGREVKELIFIASSQVRGCRYCAGTHSRQMVQIMGFTREQVERARAGEGTGLSPRDRALVDFARRTAGDPKRIGPEDVAGLKAYGLDEDEIVEALAVVAFSALTNAFADALHLADDFVMMGIEGEVF